MQYRHDKYGNPISILGYGCMRFTKKGNKIDIDKAEQEVMAAFHAGVNYYDTAYIYPGNEEALGEVVARNGIREKIHIATKLPHYFLKTKADAFMPGDFIRTAEDFDRLCRDTYPKGN